MAKRESSRSKRQKQRRRTLLIVGGVIVLALAGALVLAANRSSAPAVDADRLALDPTIGPEDAPVTIVEYGDLGCPSCRAWHNAGIREQILATYGEQVRFVFKDFPIITPQSPLAAEAGQCALDQGRFWEYHDYVYENYQGLYEPDLLFYAGQTGLDVEAFERCLQTNQHRATVRADWQEAEQLRLPGTPSFLINGQPLIGPPYYETFVEQIDAALAGS